MPSIQMVFNLRCLIRHDAEAGVFVSHCPALGIYSQGETDNEAQKAIESAVILYVATAYDCDRLDQVLRRAGFRATPQGAPPQIAELRTAEFIAVRDNGREVDISVPMTLLASNNSNSECLQ